jgi:hypothetical protein
MLFSARRSTSDLLHACTDAAIATVAGGLVILVFYPVTLCAEALKGILKTLGLHARETRERAERRNDSQPRQHVAHS